MAVGADGAARPDRTTLALRLLLGQAEGDDGSRAQALMALARQQLVVATWPQAPEAVRTLTNAEGETALPLFTAEDVLFEAAGNFGWLDGEDGLARKWMSARDALRHAITEQVHFVVVDVGFDHAIEFSRDEIEALLGSLLADSPPSRSNPRIQAAVRRSSRPPPPSVSHFEAVSPPASRGPQPPRAAPTSSSALSQVDDPFAPASVSSTTLEMDDPFASVPAPSQSQPSAAPAPSPASSASFPQVDSPAGFDPSPSQAPPQASHPAMAFPQVDAPPAELLPLQGLPEALPPLEGLPASLPPLDALSPGFGAAHSATEPAPAALPSVADPAAAFAPLGGSQRPLPSIDDAPPPMPEPAAAEPAGAMPEPEPEPEPEADSRPPSTPSAAPDEADEYDEDEYDDDEYEDEDDEDEEQLPEGALRPLEVPLSDSLLDKMVAMLRGFPEVEWACQVSDGTPTPVVAVRVDPSFTQRQDDIRAELRKIAAARATEVSVMMLGDAASMREARAQGEIFFPWRKKT
ncbi:MAG: SseB family protein [Myxococcales bacterium]|nr:SseB family protein [Myxococcales bacterium]